MARRILAVDLGSHALKAALVESSLSSCQVTGLFQQRREPQRPLAEQLADFWMTHQLRADTVLSCIPGDAVSCRLLTLPFTQTRKLSQAVPFELEAHILFSLDEVVVTEQVVKRTTDGTLVLAVAIPKPAMAEHLAVFTQAGIEPARVAVAPLAPLPLLSLAGNPLPPRTALLDVGEKRTSVVLLQEGLCCGLRTFGIGLSHAGGLTAWLQELRWTLLALGNEKDPLPSRIFLCGGGALFAQLHNELAHALGVEVVPFQQLTIPGVTDHQREQQAIFANCLGMGFHEALRSTTPIVDCRRGEFALRKHNEIIRHEWRRLGWLAAGVTVAAGVAFAVDLYRLQARYELIQQEIRRVFVATLPEVQTIVHEKMQLEDALADLQKRQSLIKGAGGGSPLDVLRQISAVIPEQVTLELEEWTLSDEAIYMRGTTMSFEATEAIKTAILSLGIFREAQLKDMKTVTGSKKVAFGLQLFFKEEKSQVENLEENSAGQQAEVLTLDAQRKRRGT
ncbi:MAG: type II secretion system protein GspL [Candidatus Binatia bacterium]